MAMLGTATRLFRPVVAVLLLGLALTGCTPTDCSSLLATGPEAGSDIAVLPGVAAADQAPSMVEVRNRAFEKILQGGLGRKSKLYLDVVGDGPGSDRVTVHGLEPVGPNELQCKNDIRQKTTTYTQKFTDAQADRVDGPLDVLSALSSLASNLDASVGERGVDVVIMSSMLNATSDLPLDAPGTLERDPDELLAHVGARGRLGSCTGWRVYVVGAGRTTDTNLDAASFNALHVFYDRLFNRCGGTLWRFASQLPDFPAEKGPAPDGVACARLAEPDDVFFDSGSAVLRPGSDVALATVLDFVNTSLATDPDRTVVITGHTDSDGDAAYNLRLSTDRANAILAWLLNQRLSGLRVKADGHGEDRLIDPELTPEGKARNRRVEVTVLC